MKLDKTNGIVCGVCSGIERKFGFDATILRLIFVIGSLYYGVLILIYFLIAILSD